MTVERWTDDMLDRLASAVAEQSQQIDELRDGQRLLVQIVADDREASREFRQTTNAALDRIEATVSRLVEGQERHALMLERHQVMLERHQAMLERMESLSRGLAAGQERQERLLDYLMQRDRDRN